jgi:uncharacterized protein (TIGR02391 family)
MTHPALDAQQSHFLNGIADEWRRTSSWSLSAVLKVRHRKQGLPSPDEMLQALPYGYYSRRGDSSDLESERIQLTPAAVERTDGGLADVQPLLELVRLAAKRRSAFPYAPAVVTGDDLRELLGPGRACDYPRLARYCLDFWPGSASSNAHDPSIIQLFGDLHIIRFETVSSGEEYMALKSPGGYMLDDWRKLTGEHIDIIRAIYRRWRETASWPKLVDFILEERTRGDVLRLVRELPYTVIDTSFGTMDEQLGNSRLRLRLLGVALVAKEAEPALFVKMLPVLGAHYENTVGQDTAITAEEVAQQLGAPVEDVRRLGQFFSLGVFPGLRFTEVSGESWSAKVTQEVLGLSDVKTADDYLAWQGKARDKTADQVAASHQWRTDYESGDADYLSAADHFVQRCFHRDIAKGVEKLYRDGHRAEAVERGFKLLLDRMKERSNRRDLDGVDLVNTVLSPKNPVLAVNVLANDFDRSEQQGWLKCFAGAQQAVRNAIAHDPKIGLSELEALDRLTNWRT